MLWSWWYLYPWEMVIGERMEVAFDKAAVSNKPAWDK